MCSLLTITRTTTIQNVLHKRFTSSHLQNIADIITFYGIKTLFELLI